MPVQRYIHAGIYTDRDGQIKDIEYTFRKKANGELHIGFQGDGGCKFKWWNTGVNKIDMITWEPWFLEMWSEYIADDGSWVPRSKTKGRRIRHEALIRTFFDRTWVDPYFTRGRQVTVVGSPVNTAHAGAGPIPGGGITGNRWVSPLADLERHSDDEELDSDSGSHSESESDSDTEDGRADQRPDRIVADALRALPRQSGSREPIVVEDSSDDSSDEEEDVQDESSLSAAKKKEKGKGKVVKRPRLPFSNMTHHLFSPSPSPSKTKKDVVKKIRQAPPPWEGLYDIAEDDDGRMVIDLTADENDVDILYPDIPIQSIEEEPKIKTSPTPTPPPPFRAYQSRRSSSIARRTPIRLRSLSTENFRLPSRPPAPKLKGKRMRTSHSRNSTPGSPTLLITSRRAKVSSTLGQNEKEKNAEATSVKDEVAVKNEKSSLPPSAIITNISTEVIVIDDE